MRTLTGAVGAAGREFGKMLLILALMVVCVGGSFLPFGLLAWWLSGQAIPSGSDAEGPWPVTLFTIGLVVALGFGIPLLIHVLERTEP